MSMSVLPEAKRTEALTAEEISALRDAIRRAVDDVGKAKEAAIEAQKSASDAKQKYMQAREKVYRLRSDLLEGISVGLDFDAFEYSAGQI